MAYNPRFPYKLKVLRAEFDENGEPVFDGNGNSVYHGLAFDVVEYESHLPKMMAYEIMPLPDSSADTEAQEGVYVPETKQCTEIPFGYRQQTANALVSGDVIMAEMKIACPMIIGEIATKDILELTDRDRTYRAEVVKKINTNFGTNIWFNEVKQ